MGIAHLQVLGPKIAPDAATPYVRNWLYTIPQTAGTVTIELKTAKILHKFGPSSYFYSPSEADVLFTDITHDIDASPISIRKIPRGIQLQVVWFDGKPLIATPSIAKANEARFGTQTTLLDALYDCISAEEAAALKDALQEGDRFEFILSHPAYIENAEKLLYVVSNHAVRIGIPLIAERVAIDELKRSILNSLDSGNAALDITFDDQSYRILTSPAKPLNKQPIKRN